MKVNLLEFETLGNETIFINPLYIVSVREVDAHDEYATCHIRLLNGEAVVFADINKLTTQWKEELQ